MTIDDVIRWAREYPNPTIMRSEVVRVLALAAATRRAKTPKAVECEASHSGGGTPQRPTSGASSDKEKE